MAAQELHNRFMKWWAEVKSHTGDFKNFGGGQAGVHYQEFYENYMKKFQEVMKEIEEGKVTDPSAVLKTLGTPPVAKANWVLQNALDWVFPTAKLGQYLASKAKELAAQTNNPLLKQFYDAVSYAFMTGGIAATGPYASMLSSAVPGAGPALILAGLAQLSAEINAYKDDPIYREQLQDFLNRVKSGDKDAIATLASMIVGTALAGYLAVKVPKIKVGGVELGARIRSSVGSKLRGLAERLRSLGYDDLAKKVEALAKKYSTAGVFRGDVTETPSTQRWEVKYDSKRGVLEIVYNESGEVVASGKVTEIDIPENVLRSVATKYGYSIDDVANALRNYLSVYVKGGNADDVITFLKNELSSGNVEFAGRVINEMVRAVKSKGKAGVFITQDKVVFLDTAAQRGDVIRLEVVDARNPTTKVLVYFNKKYGTPVSAVVVKNGKVLAGDAALEVLRTVFNRGNVYGVLEKTIPDWPRLWATIQSNPDILSSIQTETFRFQGGEYGTLTVATPKGLVKFSKVHDPVLVIDGKEIPLKAVITEFKKYSFDKLRSGVNTGDYYLQVVAKIKLPPLIAQKVQSALGKTLSDAVKAIKSGMSEGEATQMVMQELKEVVGNATDSTQLTQLAQFLVKTAEKAASGGSKEVILPVITSNGSEASVLFASISAGASQAIQQAQQTQANLVNTAVTTIERLKASGATQVTTQDIMEMLGISLTQAQQVMGQVINRLGLKTIEVPIEVPQTQEVTKEVPVIVQVERLDSASITRPLKEVVVNVEIPKVETFTKEVTVPVTMNVMTGANITRPLRLIQVNIDIPQLKTVTKEVPIITDVETPLGLTITKSLREVIIPVNVPQLKTVTVEVPKEITLEDYTGEAVTGNVIQIPVPKTVQVVVPYYQVIDVPINMNGNTPPPPSPPPTPTPPLPAPPLAPQGISYGSLPPGAFRPPKRRKQEEVVMI